jgi:hypothetical protein
MNTFYKLRKTTASPHVPKVHILYFFLNRISMGYFSPPPPHSWLLNPGRYKYK